MPIPTTYSEPELRLFMLESVGSLADVLGLTTDHFDEAINETLLSYDVDDLSDATDIRKLRALARVEAARVAVRRSAGWYNMRSGQDSLERATVHKQAKEALADAIVEAGPYDVDGYRIRVGGIWYEDENQEWEQDRQR